jgi:EAL domain-containing protein (putative c-di-GMP-specific phosphodiesterase class I)
MKTPIDIVQDSDESAQAWILYLAAPDIDVQTTFHRVIQQFGLQMSEPFPNVLAVAGEMPVLCSLAASWQAQLEAKLLQRTKCFLATDRSEPGFADLMQSQTLAELIDWMNGQWVKQTIREKRLATHFQPIVQCSEPNHVFAYECLLRGEDDNGDLISPFHLYNAARGAGVLCELDQAARLTAIESASVRNLSTRVFINFNPRSIEHPSNLDSTLRAALECIIPTEQFVFEVVESDEVRDPDALMDILDICREAGCRVALDDLGAGYSSLNLMAHIKPDFIKLDMDLIRDVDKDVYKSCVASKLLELARELGVGTVVEGVETVGQLQWAIEHGADFAQGYLFARPNADPPQPPFCAVDDCASGDTADGQIKVAMQGETSRT